MNKNGKAPIYCRITVNGKRAEISTGIFINPSLWIRENVKETTNENVLINAQLAKIRTKINEIYLNLSLKDKYITANRIKEIYVGKTEQNYSLISMIDEFLKVKFSQLTKYSSTKTYKRRAEIIKAFLQDIKRTEIGIDEFNYQLAERFYEWCVFTKKYCKNYTNKCVMFIKAAINYAVRMDHTKNNPIMYYTVKRDKTKAIVALDKNELQLLQHYKFASTRLQEVADLYVFQSYTGFAYADLMDFNYFRHVKTENNIQFILKSRVKIDDSEAIIPLFDGANKILAKYGYKLPVISNQKYNAYLKEVAEILDIKKNLTTHTARKTFAMIKLNEGFSIETVSKMLGHSNTKITQSTYAQVNQQRILNEAARLGVV